MASQITQTQNATVTAQMRAPARPAATDAQSSKAVQNRPAPPRTDRPEAPRPAPEAGQSSDRVTLRTRDVRDASRAVQASGQRVTSLQTAGQRVDEGMNDLERLGRIAAESEQAPAEADRSSLQEEARSIDERLARTDEDPDVRQARDSLRQTTLDRTASQARSEADQLGRQADAARRSQERSQPPTLVLEPRQGGDTEVAREAEQAERSARAAEEAAVSERRQAERAQGGETGIRQSPVDTSGGRNLRPERVEVGTREEARATRQAVDEAQTRASRFRDELGQAEQAAGREAEQTTRAAAAETGTRRVTTEAQGRQTAERIRQTAQQEPGRFVQAQARVSADAAARLLA